MRQAEYQRRLKAQIPSKYCFTVRQQQFNLAVNVSITLHIYIPINYISLPSPSLVFLSTTTINVTKLIRYMMSPSLLHPAFSLYKQTIAIIANSFHVFLVGHTFHFTDYATPSLICILSTLMWFRSDVVSITCTNSINTESLVFNMLYGCPAEYGVHPEDID